MCSYIEQELLHAPTAPGVYQMLDGQGKVIYVGKANNLRTRIGYYTKHDLTGKTALLVQNVRRCEYLICNSPDSALILEAQLIKKLQPKFNILLKDSKGICYITIDLSHQYPKIEKHKGRIDFQTLNKNTKCFGPFVSIKQVEHTIKELCDYFRVRTCSDYFFSTRKRPCLQYQIGLCSAPCVKEVDQEQYADNIKQIIDFLSGKNYLQEKLLNQMEEFSRQMRFEEAAKARNKIRALSYSQASGNTIPHSKSDVDIIAFVFKQKYCAIKVFSYRNRFYHTSTDYACELIDNDNSESITQFFIAFYQHNTIPEEIIVNINVQEAAAIENLFLSTKNKKVKITNPYNNSLRSIMNNVEDNAHAALEKFLDKAVQDSCNLLELQKILGLLKPIRRIEVYDNSHISGAFAVGVMVVLTSDGFDKREYRKFNVTHPKQIPDDYYMLSHALTKRLSKLCEGYENQSRQGHEKFIQDIPDVMLIDGGVGHFNIAHNLLKQYNLDDRIAVITIAKGEYRNKGGESFYTHNGPFTLDNDSSLMKYLQIARDEAHRFALNVHKRRRSKALSHSILDNMHGIGPARKKKLLTYLGSVEAVMQASAEQIRMVPGISDDIAQELVKIRKSMME
ncbi:UvrABC system protein C [Rickettsiales endosymbiont of Paramecium tredecaurelia]|nr:UvrABC system protein C [Candidatus Sarmatiella mevalonica]